MNHTTSTRERPRLDALDDTDALAATLIADAGHLGALEWLEDELAVTDCPRAASLLCNIIDAVEAQSRGRLH